MESRKRIAYWDNFKGILIFLVVFTHFLYNFTNLEYGKYIVNIIYFFHMPAFIFISGYFSKKEITWQKFLRYIVIYLIFNSIFTIFTAVTTHEILLFTPFFSYWYLLALIIWRVITKYIKCDKWYVIIPLSFLISLLCGFASDVSNVLAIEKVIGFLPFFLIGYYLPENFIISFTQKRKWWVNFIGFIIFTFAVGSSYFIAKSMPIQKHLLMETYETPTDIFIRMLVYLIALVASFGIFCMVPNKTGKYNLIEKWGRNSLWIYVFHRPITLVFAKAYSGPTNLYLPICLVLTLAISMIFGSDKMSNFCSQCINKIVKN